MFNHSLALSLYSLVVLGLDCCQSCQQSYRQLVTVEFDSFSFSTFLKCKLPWKLIKTQGRFLITVQEHVPDWSNNKFEYMNVTVLASRNF